MQDVHIHTHCLIRKKQTLLLDDFNFSAKDVLILSQVMVVFQDYVPDIVVLNSSNLMTNRISIRVYVKLYLLRFQTVNYHKPK